MQPDSGKAKEANILSLSHDLLKRLSELRGTLNNSFDRNPEATEKDCEKQPQQPNVLDEIIDNLQSANTKLHADIVFISNEVLPKID